MLGNSALKTFEHKYFFSMVDRDDPQVIPDFFAQNIENWLIRDRGELVMRDGLTAKGTSPSSTNLGSTVLYQASQAPLFIRVIDGAANTAKFQQSSDGSTWTDITGGGSRTTGRTWNFVQANNAIYGLNGVDTAVKITVSGLSTVAGIPLGTTLEWWKNFLWVIGVSPNLDRTYFSGASTPETFGGSDYINVNLGDVSPAIGVKGTSGGSGRLYIGKARSVWYITGTASTDFAVQPLTYEHGVASQESMVQVENDMWCVDLEGNVRGLYRTSTDNPFSAIKSADIQTTIAGLNKSAITKATAVYFNNYALFFVPNGVDDYNSLCLVYDTLANEAKGGWIKFTGWRIARATIFNEGQPKLFLHDARTNNGQTYQWTGTSDNGISITAKYETKVYDHGLPEYQKLWRFAFQFAPVIGDVNMKFYCSIDRYYYVLLKTINLQGTGNKKLGVDWTLGTDKLGSGGFVKQEVRYNDAGGQDTGYTQQVKLEAESSTVKIKVRRFTSHYRTLSLR